MHLIPLTELPTLLAFERRWAKLLGPEPYAGRHGGLLYDAQGAAEVIMGAPAVPTPLRCTMPKQL